MKHTFYKYQGTGNDFVMIDNRNNIFDKTNITLVSELCDRRFGVGADGLILIENHPKVDFEMIYFNADGSQSLCGNGGRCAVAFAKYLEIIETETTFEAIDGVHYASIEGNEVKLKMLDVPSVDTFANHQFVDTGSPHHVEMRQNINTIDIRNVGASIRYGKPYNEEGANVNFVEKVNDEVFVVRTYERGVEDETLSCGTGVTAVALSMNYIGETEKNLITLKTEGGDLKVSFKKNTAGYNDVWLIGPATFVFKGELTW